MARAAAVWTFRQGSESASIRAWRSTDDPHEGQVISGGVAEGNLFDAIGLRVIDGRGFAEVDRQKRPQVAIVNEAAALLLDGPAVGNTLRVAPRDGDFQSSMEVRIVGVVEAATEPRLERGERPAAKIYLPSPIQPEPALALYARTSGPPADSNPTGPPSRRSAS